MDAPVVESAPDNNEIHNQPEKDPEKPDKETANLSMDAEKMEEINIPILTYISPENMQEKSEEKQDDPGNVIPEEAIKDTETELETQQPIIDSIEPALNVETKLEEEKATKISENVETPGKTKTEETDVKPVLQSSIMEVNENEQKPGETQVSILQQAESQDLEQSNKEEDADVAGSVPYNHSSFAESTPMEDVVSTESKVSSQSIVESNLDVSTTPGKSIEDNEERMRLIEEYKKAVTEHRIAKEANLQLQTKLAEYFRRKKADAVEQQSATSSWGGSTVDAIDYEQRYNKYLASLSDLRRQFQEMQVSYQKQIEELKNVCSQRQEEVDRAYAEFTNYKYSIGKRALNSRTGRPINPKDLAALFAAEQKKEAIVMQVRLDNIKLRNEVNKVEAILKEKEELADGLHLIDFEQLKIENQTYNEKIEERNEELSKLRRKISSTVQIMTHVKEKLQAIQQDNAQQKQRLSIADAELTFNRDQLTKLKQNRDRLRAENARLKRSSGLLGKNALLFNYEDSVDAVASKKAALKETKDLINQYQQQTFRLQKKIESFQESKSMY